MNEQSPRPDARATAIDEPELAPLRLPDSLEMREIRIWSDGYDLDATLFVPKDRAEDVPGVVLSHGWGGGKKSVELYAVRIAERGMAALIFSHDGWYGSSGRMQVVDEALEVDEEGIAQARVRVVRELIDPWNWIRNFRAATDYLATETGVNAQRLGAWGTSFGAGTALYCASTDDRFRAVIAQAGYLQGPTEQLLGFARHRAGEIARGEIPPFPVGVDGNPAFRGELNVARMQHYDPLAAIERLQAATLIIDAEHEELFDRMQSGARAHKLLSARGDLDVRYEVIPNIDHYGIYSEGLEFTSDAAVDWYGRYL